MGKDLVRGFPGTSAGKELPAMQETPLITGSERFPGEGIDYPLQYSWASLVAHMGKNPPAMQETRLRSLGQEDPLEKGMAIHPSILAGKTPRTEEPEGLQSLVSQSRT